jgi:hypothetical protein
MRLQQSASLQKGVGLAAQQLPLLGSPQDCPKAAPVMMNAAAGPHNKSVRLLSILGLH